jgi:hypothetical protein
MRYMMFVATDPTAEPFDPAGDTIEEWVKEGTERGINITGSRLRPVEDATTVRLRDGEVLVTDGPFTESKEWIAGFDIIECENLDEAIDYASRHPMARFGRIELRPFWPFEDE